MTATERLRKLLEERGEDYTRNDFGITWSYYTDPHTATESMDGTLIVTGLTPEQAIAATLGTEINGDTSDGYHTFNELYHHRAVLFSVIVRDHSKRAWKARKHHDGTMYDGMFIVGIETPDGQATYHYDLDPYWDMFDCEEREFAPEWDGHTPDEAIARIATLGSGTCRWFYPQGANGWLGYAECSNCGYRVYENTIDEREFVYCPQCGKKVNA